MYGQGKKEYFEKKNNNILCSKNMCALVLGQGGDDARAVVSSRNQAFSMTWPSWRRIFCAISIGGIEVEKNILNEDYFLLG